MKGTYIPIEEQLVEEKDVTQCLIRIKPIPHDQNNYMKALHQKTYNESCYFERRPQYENSIFNNLSKQQNFNTDCKKCSNVLSWTAGKVLCQFCGFWYCNSCIAKQRYDPKDQQIRTKICYICQESYLKNTVMHQYFVKQNILESAFKKLVNQQFQLQKLLKQQIKRINQNEKKSLNNNAMCKLIAINDQKTQNDELKEEVQILKQKMNRAEKIYQQLVTKCQSNKKILLENKVSFASEISRVQLADDDQSIQPPTAVESPDGKKQRSSSRSQSFVSNILDEYNKNKDGTKRQDQEGNSKPACQCNLM